MPFERPTRKIEVDPSVDFNTDNVPSVPPNATYGFHPAILGSPSPMPRKIGTAMPPEASADSDSDPTPDA